MTFSLSPGQAHDAPEGRKLLDRLGPQGQDQYLLMDRAYEGNETRQLALALGFTPVAPPKVSRIDSWEYDREMYKRRNEIERLFRRLKGFRRIFSRFEKLDALFLGFILSPIHRTGACERPPEETKGCSTESGIMVLEQKTARKQGAPNRC